MKTRSNLRLGFFETPRPQCKRKDTMRACGESKFLTWGELRCYKEPGKGKAQWLVGLPYLMREGSFLEDNFKRKAPSFH
jgi:hypothetical protein